MENSLSHCTAPSMNGILSTSIVVPLTHGRSSLVSGGTAPMPRSQAKTVFLAAASRLVPVGTVLSVAGAPSSAVEESSDLQPATTKNAATTTRARVLRRYRQFIGR